MKLKKQPTEGESESEESRILRFKEMFEKSRLGIKEREALSRLRLNSGSSPGEMTYAEFNLHDKLFKLKGDMRLPAMKIAARLMEWSPDAINALSRLDDTIFSKNLKIWYDRTEKLIEEKKAAPQLAFAIVSKGISKVDKVLENIQKLREHGVSETTILNSIGNIKTRLLLESVENLKSKGVGAEYAAKVAIGLFQKNFKDYHRTAAEGIKNFYTGKVPYTKVIEVLPELTGDKAMEDFNGRSVEFIRQIELNAENLDRDFGMYSQEARNISVDMTCKLGIDRTQRLMDAIYEVMNERLNRPAQGSEEDLAAANKLLDAYDKGLAAATRRGEPYDGTKDVKKVLKEIYLGWKPPETARKIEYDEEAIQRLVRQEREDRREEDELWDRIKIKHRPFRKPKIPELPEWEILVRDRLLQIPTEERVLALKMVAQLYEWSTETRYYVHQMCAVSNWENSITDIENLYNKTKKLVDAEVNPKKAVSFAGNHTPEQVDKVVADMKNGKTAEKAIREFDFKHMK
jgi:hypothetical protein